MRLHHLELSAFGPFADSVRVDLDELGADGLFLLHGETGAGKTTMLDAVAFALYGSVPGARGEAKRLRCDRAEPGTPTRVRLELTVSGRRLEITRNPDYLRPKTRGTGMTTQKAAVTLRWIGAAPEGLPSTDLTRAEEVGRIVRDLVGMSAEQFFQVVLLPQGEFARFLRADTAEREVLLEKLFDTGRFADLEKWFAERRRIVRAAAAAADVGVDRELARVCEAAGLVEAVGPVDAAGPIDLPVGDEGQSVDGDGQSVGGMVVWSAPESSAADAAWLAALRAELADRADRAAAVAAIARGARDVAAAALVDGQRRDEAVLRRLALQQERDDVAAGREEHRALVDAVTAAERAEPVLAANRDVLAAQASVAAAEKAVSVARAAVPVDFHPPQIVGHSGLDRKAAPAGPAENDTPDSPDSDERALRGAADLIRDQVGSLGVLAGLDAEQRRDLAERDSLSAALAQAERDLTGVDARLAAMPEQQAAIDAELATRRKLAGRVSDCDAALARATEIHKAAVAVPELQATLAATEQRLRATVDAHQAARDRRQLLIERRIAGMAAELAGQLVGGRPCAVCGSTAHPDPARATDDQVDAAAIEAARREERQAEQARADADVAVAAARTTLAAASATAQGRDATAARSALDAAAAEQRAARQAVERLPALESAARDCTDRTAELTSTRTSLIARLEGLRTSVAALRRAITERADRLSQAAAGFASVGARREHLLQVAGGLDAWASAAGERRRAATVLRAAIRRSDSAVAQAGFADIAAAEAAAELDLPRATDRVRQYQERSLVVATQLAAPELAVSGPLIRPDLEVLQARAAETAAQADEATAAAHQATHRCERVAAAAERLTQAWAARAPLASEAARVSALADVIAGHGQNAKALSLRSYVLAAKLQQVALAAGERLARMSGGRYTFVHSDDREARGKSGGLGLDILDSFSGLARPAKTLSGGESFLASLSLALGLADVVAAESGGRMLDTIFIDEGFGSLDSDALDLVMSTLDELRAGGRVVGVVSHVDEMRQRIPSRLRVRKTPEGSVVELTALRTR